METLIEFPSTVTAIDASVLLDITKPDSDFVDQSLKALKTVAEQGPLIISDVALAEVAVDFSHQKPLFTQLQKTSITLKQSNDEVSWKASRYFQDYLEHEKKENNRQKITPDFFIAAHASIYANQLLTRDQDFQKSYFTELPLVYPKNVAS